MSKSHLHLALRLDSDLRVVEVSEDWQCLARELGLAAFEAPAAIGRPISDWIDPDSRLSASFATRLQAMLDTPANAMPPAAELVSIGQEAPLWADELLF